MHVEITAPTEYVGDIMGDLNSPPRPRRRRGRRRRHADHQRARADVGDARPTARTLRSITQGRGSFHMEFSHYEEVPKQLQEKIITESKKAKEAQAAAHSH